MILFDGSIHHSLCKGSLFRSIDHGSYLFMALSKFIYMYATDRYRCIYTCICICKYPYTCLHIYYIQMYLCLYVYMYAYVHTHISISMCLGKRATGSCTRRRREFLRVGLAGRLRRGFVIEGLGFS